MASPPSSITPGTGSWIWTNPFGIFPSSTFSIGSITEIDTYRFQADVTGSYTISVSGGTLDSILRVYNSSGASIAGPVDTKLAGGIESVSLSLTAGNWYYISVGGFGAGTGSTGTYFLRINGPAPVINNIATDAPTYSGTFNGGKISQAGDIDWFKLVAPVGTTSLSFSTSGLSAGLDTVLQLLDSNGNSLLGVVNNGGAGLGDLASTSITAGATYYVGVTSLGSGSYNFNADFNPNQSLPVLSIAALSADKVEGNNVTTPFTFTVTRTGDASASCSVQWTIGANQSPAADASDFGGPTGGTLSWAAGESSPKTITVAVNGDTTYEGGGLPEHFTVNLSNALGATIGTATANGNIQNDDSPPQPPVLSIAALSADKVEGNNVTTPFTFTVTRTGDPSASCSVQWAIGANQSPAADASDFGGPTGGTLSWAAGESSPKTITVAVNGDTTYEGGGLPEHFTVNLSNAIGAMIGTATANGNIRNDDSPPQPPVLSIAALSADKVEGNNVTTPFTFTVTRTGDPSASCSVQWAIGANQSPAADASDFGGPTGGTLSWAAGDSSPRTITVAVNGDTTYEGGGLPEHFTVNLSNALGATIGTATANGNIQNDDSNPSVIGGTVSVNGFSFPVSIQRTDGAAINPTQTTWLIIHGWNSKPAEFTDLTNAVRGQRSSDQILTLDWHEGADTGRANPFLAESRIPQVASWAAMALADAGFSGSNLNEIGHSFGSYIADEIAKHFTGGVNTIIGLDPAANTIGYYDSEASINFARDSMFSWAFHDSDPSDYVNTAIDWNNPDTYDGFGNSITPITASEAFDVANTGHTEITDLFTYLLSHQNDAVGQYFTLQRLLSHAAGLWNFNAYDATGAPASNGGYEAVISASNHGATPESIVGVDDYAANSNTTGVITPAGNHVTGNIDWNSDRDWFRVQVIQGSTYTITLVSGNVPQATPVLANPEVFLYDLSSHLVGSNDDFAELNSQLTFTAAYSGAYFVGAGAHGDNATGTYQLSVGVNDPPALSVAAAASYTENGAAVTLSSAAAVSDPDNATLASATVTISGGLLAGDVLSVNGVASGASNGISWSYTAATGVLAFTGAASLANYQTLLDAVQYASTSDNPTNAGANASRVVSWLVTDGSLSNATVPTTTISITARNDPPALSVAAAASYTENGAAVTLSSAAAVSDPDNATLASATVTISGGLLAGDVLSVNGVASGASNGISWSYTAATGVLAFTGAASLANYQTLLDAVQYASTSDNPTNAGANASRAVSWLVTDGSLSNATVPTTTISITATNDPPALSVAAAASYTENGAAVTLSSAAAVSDPDNATLASATVTISGGLLAGDVLSVNGVASGASNGISWSYTAATGVLAFTGAASLANYQTLLDAVQYASTSDNPTNAGANASRAVSWLVTDGSLSNATVPTTTISITATNDLPVTKNDTFSTDEAAALDHGLNVFDDNGLGADSDPDGSPLSVIAVDGDTTAVGTQTTLASGALLTLNADGTFSYDPNHAFDATPAAGSGASNTSASDTFIYTVDGGSMATVTIILAGLDSNDTLRDNGASGAAAMLVGGIGNDLYLVDNPDDQAIEAVGRGSDKVVTSVSFALGAGQEIESLQTSDPSGTSAINLTGNEFANTITGNAGVNFLDGQGSADTMTGFAGNDYYIVENAGDMVREAVGGGFDVVFTSVDYRLGTKQEIERLQTRNTSGTDAIDLTGNEFANTIFGNGGRNVITGGGGADIMIGYVGDDYYHVDNAGDLVREAVGGGADTVFTSVDYALTAHQEIERLQTSSAAGTGAIGLTGNEFANTIFGNAGKNVIDGGKGADTMTGFGGNDYYYVDNVGDVVREAAGGGTDLVYARVSCVLTAGQEIERLQTTDSAGTDSINLTGNQSANAIYGNAGKNVIDGGAGNDTLTGFGGNDTFVFDTALNASTNIDKVVDFAPPADTIHLAHAIFTKLATGGLAPNAFYGGTAAHDADDRIVYNASNGALTYDSNGSAAGGATQFATLHTGLAMTYKDFVVV